MYLITQSSSLSDAQGTEALALRKVCSFQLTETENKQETQSFLAKGPGC